MKGYVCLLMLFLATTLVAQSKAAGSQEEAVIKTTDAWLHAEQQRDIPSLQQIIGDDFVGNGPGGAMIDKDEVLSIPENAHPFDKAKIVGASAKVFGPSAVEFGRIETTDSADPPAMRFAMFYVKRAGEWRMVAAQLVPIPAEKGTAGE